MGNSKLPTEEASAEISSLSEYKVVIRFGSGGTAKGCVAARNESDLADLFGTPNVDNPGSIQMRSNETNTMVDVPLRDVKAVFVVKSFRGDSKRKGIRFYANGPGVGGIWVEIRFRDNEVIEGTIENSVRHLLGEGLLLRPSDEESNNLAVYINKAAIASYRVLGIRPCRES
jgi:hypothetical protein